MVLEYIVTSLLCLDYILCLILSRPSPSSIKNKKQKLEKTVGNFLEENINNHYVVYNVLCMFLNLFVSRIM